MVHHLAVGATGKWPANGELEIMEYYNGGILANFVNGGDKLHQVVCDGSSKTVESFGEAAYRLF